jgi:hypothetical protein
MVILKRIRKIREEPVVGQAMPLPGLKPLVGGRVTEGFALGYRKPALQA